MRSLVLGFLFLAVSAHADAINDALKTTVKDLMTIVAIPNQAQRAQQLCSLVKNDVDLSAIGPQLLGSFANYEGDDSGIKAFYALVPSIIVTDFYGLVSDKAGANYTVDSRAIPKGSSKVGYSVTIGGTTLVVTMSRKTNKVLDVEWNNFSLIQTKSSDYQTKLQNDSAGSTRPVTDLVNNLKSSGNLIRCN